MTVDFLFAPFGKNTLPDGGQLLKERICSYRSILFPLRVDTYCKQKKNANGRGVSPES